MANNCNIVFARTRWNYDSYTDFWRLVELSQYPIVYVDEMDTDRDDVVYILSPMNGEVRPFMETRKDRKAKVYMWNLERPGGSGSPDKYKADNEQILHDGILDGILVSDRALAEYTGFNFVPLGSHALLGSPSGLGERLMRHVIHLSCYSPHRHMLFEYPSSLRKRLGEFSVLDNGWGQLRHDNLRLASFMLNVHQDGFPYIEPLRFALAAAYGLPIISEACQNVYPYTGEYWVVQSSNVMELLNDAFVADLVVYHERFYPAGLEMRRYLTTVFDFRTCLEVYLEI